MVLDIDGSGCVGVVADVAGFGGYLHTILYVECAICAVACAEIVGYLCEVCVDGDVLVLAVGY